jgi:hypothetical protein
MKLGRKNRAMAFHFQGKIGFFVPLKLIFSVVLGSCSRLAASPPPVSPPPPGHLSSPRLIETNNTGSGCSSSHPPPPLAGTTTIHAPPQVREREARLRLTVMRPLAGIRRAT